MPDNAKDASLFNYNSDFSMSSCQKDLQGSPCVLVGHNIFHDIVFIHETFLGPLPDDLSTFIRTMHELFPLIVDTKYLQCQAIPKAQYAPLVDLFHTWQRQDFPVVCKEEGYAYEQPKGHEAGCDSELIPLHIILRLHR